MLAEQIINYIRGNRRRLIGIILAVFLVWFFLSFTLINISTTDSGKLTLQGHTGRSDRGKEISPGLRLVRRGGYRLELSSGTQSTRLQFSAPPLWVTSKSIQLKPERDFTKVTRDPNTADCSFNRSNTTYICVNGKIYQIPDGLISESPVIKNMSLLGQPSYYQNGILSVASFDDPEESGGRANLLYTDGDKAKVLVTDLSQYISDPSSVLIASLPDQQSYAIGEPNSAAVHIFKTSGDSNPTKVDFSDEVDSSQQITNVNLSITKDNIYAALYLSKQGIDQEDHGEDFDTVRIVKAALSDGKISEVKTPSEAINASDITVTDTNMYISNGLASEATLFTFNGKKPKKEITLTNTVSSAVHDGDFYYAVGEKVYVYSHTDNASYSLANINTVQISQLLNGGDGILVTGDSDRLTVGTSSYVVYTDRKVKGNSSIAKFMPYDLNELPLLKSDYVGNTLIFNIDLKSATIDRDTGATNYEPTEFELKKEVVLRRLKLDGIDTTKYNIVFIPGP